MKKILIINGSPRIGQTKRAIDIFVSKLQNDFECETMNLRDMNLAYCKGCAACLSRGEEFCPGKEDDLALILRKMDEADAIVFATPNFVLNVPALLKNLFDRLAFAFHRPRFFNKVFTSIITQGAYGGNTIEKYFKTTAGFWGGHYIPGAIMTTSTASYNPSKEWKKEEQEMVEKKLTLLAEKLKKELDKNLTYSPSLFRVFMFRLTRSSHKYSKEDNKDTSHFKEKGWFESEYFYPTNLNLLQKTVGKITDIIVRKMAKK